MSYNPNIPNITDFIALSQKQMIANFQAINASFFANHVGLTEVEDVGMHNALVLRPQSGDPTTSATQCALYNKIVSSSPQLFFRPRSNGTPIQMSNSNLNTLQTGAPASTQVTFVAGPFTFYMGYILSCPDGQLVTLTPSSTLRYVGLSTALLGGEVAGLATTAAAVGISGNQFTVSYNNTAGGITTNPNIYYTAIGS